MNSKRELFLEFQRKWNSEKIKAMTLEEYTSVGEKERQDFSYWIESRLDEIGSIWGGSAFKFGIYKCLSDNGDREKSGRIYKDGYAWYKKYGETKDQAFEKIKSIIVNIIELSQKNELEEIDNIEFGDTTKWKIAFHYQNVDDMKILNIFSGGKLKEIARGEYGISSPLKMNEIYRKILGDKQYSFEEVLEKAKGLWDKYDNNGEQKTKGNNKENVMQNLQTKDNNKRKNVLQIPLNQILYGPPGTGKTYTTINKALEILKEYGVIDEIPSDRQEAKRLFDAFKERGQIAFVTFHQSYGYEEFVEGIKPILDSEESPNPQNLSYEITDGIFKRLCESALKNYQNSKEKSSDLQQGMEIDKLLEMYAEIIQRKLDEGETLNFTGSKLTESVMCIKKVHRRKNGEIQSILIGNPNFQNTQSLSKNVIKKYYEDFKNGVLVDWRDIKPSYESQAAYHDNAIYYFTLLEKLKEFEEGEYKKFKQDSHVNSAGLRQQLKPHILIIDEINRGNIAKILGELITLIEPSKRIGESEELRVELPYSGKSFDEGRGFGVPRNLYIIGTMNTADRSIALLDTALRRRFEFVEMLPNPEVLSKDCAGVNLQALLESMNNRIAFLLDREHSIGHSYFVGIVSLQDLQNAFKNKIIPLLQEYFYEDYSKIIAVLNNNGMIKSRSMQDLGVSLSEDLVDSEKCVYEITDSSKWGAEQFVAIYDKDKAESLKKAKDSKNTESHTLDS